MRHSQRISRIQATAVGSVAKQQPCSSSRLRGLDLVAQPTTAAAASGTLGSFDPFAFGCSLDFDPALAPPQLDFGQLEGATADRLIDLHAIGNEFQQCDASDFDVLLGSSTTTTSGSESSSSLSSSDIEETASDFVMSNLDDFLAQPAFA